MTWEYDGYWAVVLGDHRSAADVIAEFDLAGATRVALDEWLGHAEAAAWSEGGEGGDYPPEWDAHHTTALADLVTASEAAS